MCSSLAFPAPPPGFVHRRIAELLRALPTRYGNGGFGVDPGAQHGHLDLPFAFWAVEVLGPSRRSVLVSCQLPGGTGAPGWKGPSPSRSAVRTNPCLAADHDIERELLKCRRRSGGMFAGGGVHDIRLEHTLDLRCKWLRRPGQILLSIACVYVHMYCTHTIFVAAGGKEAFARGGLLGTFEAITSERAHLTPPAHPRCQGHSTG